ncbi:MAG: signal peptide peptidase SppA [Myxococcota bacterium]
MDEKTDPGQPPKKKRRGARLLLGISLMGLLTLGAAAVGVIFVAQDGGLAGLGGGGGKAEGFLEVSIEPGLADAPGETGLSLDPKDFPPLVTEVASDIRHAAEDPDITGLYLEVTGADVGWASLQEIRDAIVAFSASGKPCYAYGDAYDNKAYFLASACSQIYLAPAGVMLVNGFSITTEYYAGTFEKVGVRANFEHVGDFKSAVEPFERPGPSEAASAAVDGLLDSLYGQMVAGIAAGRKLDPEVVRAIVDDPPITPEQALAAKLVDGLKYRDEVRDGLAGEERTTLGEYRPDGGNPFGGGKKIVVVHAEGSIISGESGNPVFGGSFVGDRSFAEMLEDVRDDEDVVAVVLRVNSPGGSGLASDNMWRELQRVRTGGKPVVVSMGDYAASGGYYIATASDRIVAEPGTLTGSIGVFGGKLNFGGMFEKIGVTTHTWQRGQLAGLFSGTSDFSDAERAKFRSFLETFYETFLGRVAEGRKLSRDEVHAVAQGRVWTGEQALGHKLVDELGGLDVAIARARELAGVGAEEEVTLERLPRRRTFLDQLLDDMQSAEAPAVLAELRPTFARLEALARVLDGGGVAAVMPVAIEIR